MPIITLRYTEGEILSKQRPRCTCRGGKGSSYNPPAYNNWLHMRKHQTQELNIEEVYKVRCDLLLYEFGLSDLGLDPDNTSGSIQDALVDANVLLTDTFLSIPVSTVLGFPVPPGKEFTQITLVYQGSQEDCDRYYRYRNKREALCLELMQFYRKVG